MKRKFGAAFSLIVTVALLMQACKPQGPRGPESEPTPGTPDLAELDPTAISTAIASTEIPDVTQTPEYGMDPELNPGFADTVLDFRVMNLMGEHEKLTGADKAAKNLEEDLKIMYGDEIEIDYLEAVGSRGDEVGVAGGILPIVHAPNGEFVVYEVGANSALSYFTNDQDKAVLPMQLRLSKVEDGVVVIEVQPGVTLNQFKLDSSGNITGIYTLDGRFIDMSSMDDEKMPDLKMAMIKAAGVELKKFWLDEQGNTKPGEVIPAGCLAGPDGKDTCIFNPDASPIYYDGLWGAWLKIQYGLGKDPGGFLKKSNGDVQTAVEDFIQSCRSGNKVSGYSNIERWDGSTRVPNRMNNMSMVLGVDQPGTLDCSNITLEIIPREKMQKMWDENQLQHFFCLKWFWYLHEVGICPER